MGVCEALGDSLLQLKVATDGNAREVCVHLTSPHGSDWLQTLKTAIHSTINIVTATELKYSGVERHNIIGLDSSLTPVAKVMRLSLFVFQTDPSSFL